MTEIIGLGTKNDPASLELYTKARQRIPNTQRKERHPDQQKAALELAQRMCPNAKVRSMSSTYDCVGMVFGARRTAIGAENLEQILKEDGYKLLSDRTLVHLGDVIVYRATPGGSMTHVGVVIETKQNWQTGERLFCCLSQWGEHGEYIHWEHEVPTLYGNHREFWSERLIFP